MVEQSDTTGYESNRIQHPGGMPALIQILGIEANAGLLQHFDDFFSERLFSMMLSLIGDVPFYASPRRGTDRKCRIPFLPGESSDIHFLVHPKGTCLLEFPHEISQTVSCFQTH